MKLRGAVGMSGLAPGAFDQFRTFSPTTVMGNQNGVRLSSLGNADLEPEKTTEFEGGMDIGLLNDRVSIEVTGYVARTRDALLSRNLPPSLSGRGFRDNLGSIENKGWELKFDAAMIEKDNFRWSMGFNSSGNSNEITDLGEFVQDCNAARTECRLGSARLGQSINAYFRRVVNGYDASTNRHTRTDTNVYVGEPRPSWTGSMTQTVEMGAFRLYGMLSWEKGALIQNSGVNYMIRQLGHDELLQFVNDDGTYTAQADSVLDFHRLATDYDPRDHLRLQELSVNYSFPSGLTQTLGLGRTTATLSGQNLMWWDNCRCQEPTSTAYGGNSEFSTFSFLEVPAPRQFIFTIRTTF